GRVGEHADDVWCRNLICLFNRSRGWLTKSVASAAGANALNGSRSWAGVVEHVRHGRVGPGEHDDDFVELGTNKFTFAAGHEDRADDRGDQAGAGDRRRTAS